MLKDFIQWLLNTRTTPAQAAHSAMPSNNYTRLVENGTIGSEWTAQAFSGVAAFDGYLFLRANSNNDGDASLNIKTTVAFVPLMYPYANAGSSVILQVTKGTSWTVEGSYSNEIYLVLKKTIGEITVGGVLSYLQGGAICLNNLLHFLRKHSLEIKNRGFRQLIRRIGMRMSRLTFNHYRITNLTIISKGMYRLLMALLSMQVTENPSSFVYKHKDFSLCMLADTTLWLFEFTKEKRYFYKRKILKNFVGSYRLENPNNLRFGGAL